MRQKKKHILEQGPKMINSLHPIQASQWVFQDKMITADVLIQFTYALFVLLNQVWLLCLNVDMDIKFQTHVTNSLNHVGIKALFPLRNVTFCWQLGISFLYECTPLNKHGIHYKTLYISYITYCHIVNSCYIMPTYIWLHQVISWTNENLPLKIYTLE